MTIFTDELKEKYLYVFADCYPVKGYKRSMLCDMSSKKLHFFPTLLFDLLQECRNRPIGETFDMLTEPADRRTFESFLKYLLKNNLAELVDDISLFPPLPVQWDHPSAITNTILDIGPASMSVDYKSVFTQLDELNCYHIQIRAFSIMPVQWIVDMLVSARGKKFRSIQLLLKYDPGTTEEEFIHIIGDFPVIDLIVVHSAQCDKLVLHPKTEYNSFGKVAYISQSIDSCGACGLINVNSFNIPGVEGLMENVLYNGCLNRKISIDEDGYIKNCPSMTKSYGHIGSRLLKDVVEKEENFKKLWEINKDQIATCKDCEFRYVCTDCRAYLENPTDIYSKPAKCKYNPYTAEWEN